MAAANPLAVLDDVRALEKISAGARTKTMKALLEVLGGEFASLGWASPRAGGRTGPAGPPIPRVTHRGIGLSFNLIPGGTFAPGPSAVQRRALTARKKGASPEAREHIDALLALPERAPLTVRPFLLGWVPLSGDDVLDYAPSLEVQGAPAMLTRADVELLLAAGLSLPTAEEHEWAHRATLDTLFFWGDGPPTSARFEAASGGVKPSSTNAFALMGMGAFPEFVAGPDGEVAGVRGGMADLFPYQGLGEELLGATFAPVRSEERGCVRAVWRLCEPAPPPRPRASTLPVPRVDTKRFTSLKKALRAGASVEELSLREVRLRVIPDDVRALVNLRVLDLCGTGLAALPAAVGALTSLESLDLRANDLEAVDPALGGLTRLRELAVSTHRTRFASALDVLFALPSLETLRLPSCQSLEALPAVIADHPRLAALDLWLCRALGGFPALVMRLPNLRELKLAYMDLAELPSRLTGLDGLEDLDLADNPLETIPTAFFELPLRRLHLRDMRRLVLGPDLARLTKLERLNLGALSSPVPPSLGKLGSLRALSLSNGACAVVPPSLRELHSLEELDVSCNKLEALPEEVYALPKLRRIICFNSGLTREIGALRARHPHIVFDD